MSTSTVAPCTVIAPYSMEVQIFITLLLEYCWNHFTTIFYAFQYTWSNVVEFESYKGGIPKPEKPVMEYKRESLAVVPLNPASGIIRSGASMDVFFSQLIWMIMLKQAKKSSFSTISKRCILVSWKLVINNSVFSPSEKKCGGTWSKLKLKYISVFLSTYKAAMWWALMFQHVGFIQLNLNFHLDMSNGILKWQYIPLCIQAIDETYTDFMCKVLETKLYQVLRFKHGKVDLSHLHRFSMSELDSDESPSIMP